MSQRPGGLVLDLTRLLRASRERVFATLTAPAELSAWWGPRGFTIPEIDLSLRIGGGYRFTMLPPEGDAFHLSGEFLEIDPPNRLAYTFRWDEPDPDDRETVVRLSLADAGDGIHADAADSTHDARDATRLSLWQGTFATEARLALHRDGWTDSFDKLSALIETGT